MDEDNLSLVKVVHPYREAKRVKKYKTLMISTNFFDKGLRKGGEIFLFTMIEV